MQQALLRRLLEVVQMVPRAVQEAMDQVERAIIQEVRVVSVALVALVAQHIAVVSLRTISIRQTRLPQATLLEQR
jgi:hypothetical protein